jgi:hypothetical protein
MPAPNDASLPPSAETLAWSYLQGLRPFALVATLAPLVCLAALWLWLATPETWVELPRQNGGREPVTALAFFADDRLLVGGVRGDVAVFNPESGALTGQATRGPGPVVALRMNNARIRSFEALAIYRGTNAARPYLVATLVRGGYLPGGVGGVARDSSLDFATQYPLAGVDGTGQRYAARRRGSNFEVAALASSGSDSGIAPLDSEPTALEGLGEGFVVGTRRGEALLVLGHPTNGQSSKELVGRASEFLPGPVDMIAVGGRPATEVASATRAGKISFGGATLDGLARRLALSADARRLLVVEHNGSALLLQKRSDAAQRAPWDRRDLAIPNGLAALDAALSPDGATVAVALADGEVRAFDVSQLFAHSGAAREIAACRGHKDPVAALAISPDGAKIAAADMTGRVSITDLARAAVVERIEAPFRAAWRRVSGFVRGSSPAQAG